MAAILSQNRWPVYTSGSHGDLVAIPNVTGRVRSGAPAAILGYVARRFNETVEAVRRDWSWGYAYRAVRGQTSGYSNHASATAIDLNAPRHPLGAKGTFSAAQVRAIRQILGDCEGVVRWGGDYVRRPDEMHFEILVPPSDPRLARVAAKLGGTLAPGLPSTGNKPAAPTPQEDIMTPDQEKKLDTILANTAAAFGPLGGRQHIQEQARATTAATWGAKVHRTSGAVTALQEVADAKSGILRLEGQLAGLTTALKSLAVGQGVDLDAVTAAAEKGVRQGLEGATVTIELEG